MADIPFGDPITVTSTVNLGERLKASCCGILFGVLLFLGSFPLLYWNEHRAVQRYDALKEGEAQTISISPVAINPQNDGKLVHFTASVFNGGANISDSLFGVGCFGDIDCLALQRHSEMYQWDELSKSNSKSNTGGSITTTTNYSHIQAWSSTLVNSDSFRNQSKTYENPASFQFPSKNFFANPMMAGAFVLPSNIVNWFVQDQDLIDVSVNDITDQSLRNEAKATRSTRSDGYYFGNGTDQSPKIGDEKVWFTQTPPSNITVVGVQRDSTIKAFASKTGEGGNVLLYRKGNLTASQMYDIAENQNRILTIVLRIVGFAIMAIGQIVIWSPFKVVADVIPIVGSMVGFGINFVSITIAAVLSAITIAIAWLIAHPMIGLIVLGVSLAVIGVCAVGVRMLMNRKPKNVYDDVYDDSD